MDLKKIFEKAAIVGLFSGVTYAVLSSVSITATFLTGPIGAAVTAASGVATATLLRFI